MSDAVGEWRLDPIREPGNYIRYKLVSEPLGGTEPSVNETEYGIRFEFRDGRIHVFTWGLLASAIYTPDEMDSGEASDSDSVPF